VQNAQIGSYQGALDTMALSMVTVTTVVPGPVLHRDAFARLTGLGRTAARPFNQRPDKASTQ
jgi:hypothetical protein